MRPSLKSSPRLPLCPPPSVSSKWTEHALNQGSLTPRPWISGPARNWAAQQEVSGRGTGKASSLCPAAPHPSHYRLRSASCQINDSIRVSKKHSERNVLESSGNHPPAQVHGKTVFHEMGPWCQIDWGLLIYRFTGLYLVIYLFAYLFLAEACGILVP